MKRSCRHSCKEDSEEKEERTRSNHVWKKSLAEYGEGKGKETTGNQPKE